jgi:hypothetical protein
MKDVYLPIDIVESCLASSANVKRTHKWSKLTKEQLRLIEDELGENNIDYVSEDDTIIVTTGV